MQQVGPELAQRTREFAREARTQWRVERRREAADAADLDAVDRLARVSAHSRRLVHEHARGIAFVYRRFCQRLRVAFDSAALGSVVLADVQDAHGCAGTQSS